MEFGAWGLGFRVWSLGLLGLGSSFLTFADFAVQFRFCVCSTISIISIMWEAARIEVIKTNEAPFFAGSDSSKPHDSKYLTA